VTIQSRAPEFKELTVKRLSRLLGVSRSQVYRVVKEQEFPLEEPILKLREKHPSYGYRRVAAALGASPKACRTEMNRLGVKGGKPRRSPLRIPFHLAGASNLVRSIVPSGPGQIWASDVTEVRLYGGKRAFFAAVLDVFSREVVGSWVSLRNDTLLVKNALKEAFVHAEPAPGWIHHSDRGSGYVSHDFLAFVKSLHGISSFSDPGKPTQNAFIESFFKSFKTEEGDLDIYTDLLDVERAVNDYLHLYNNERPHSALGMKAPIPFLKEYQNQ